MATQVEMRAKTREVLEEALRNTTTLRAAAAASGLSDQTIGNYLARGRAYREHLEAGGERREGEELYLHLVEIADETLALRLRAAENSVVKAFTPHPVEKRVVKILPNGQEEITVTTTEEWDPKPAQWYLERKVPSEWKLPDRLEVSGPDGDPIQVDVVTLDAIAERIASRHVVEAESREILASETLDSGHPE